MHETFWILMRLKRFYWQICKLRGCVDRREFPLPSRTRKMKGEREKRKEGRLSVETKNKLRD